MGDINSQVVTIVKQVNSITSHSYPLESFVFVPRTALKKIFWQDSQGQHYSVFHVRGLGVCSVCVSAPVTPDPRVPFLLTPYSVSLPIGFKGLQVQMVSCDDCLCVWLTSFSTISFRFCLRCGKWQLLVFKG